MKEKFISLCNKNIERAGIDKLLTWLDTTDFYTAPASTRFHGSHEGGLVEHSLAVFENMKSGIKISAENESVAIVSLFHDLCKVNFYVPEWRNKKVYSENGSKRDEGGRFDWETVQGYSVDDQFPYGHGEKSAYIVGLFMKLTVDELMAIRWHMGGFDDSIKGGSYALGNAFEKYPLALELHIADLRATYIDKK
ncbi:MAG: hydrolase [Firmicutes bacterium]|nr:hydrolase [Bacillota bacterium]